MFGCLKYKKNLAASVIFNAIIPKLPFNEFRFNPFILVEQVLTRGNLENIITFFITLSTLNENNYFF